MQPPTKKRKIQSTPQEINDNEYEIDGFIVSDDSIETKRKTKHRNKNRNKQYKYPKLTQDEKRMIAKNNNKKYIQTIDIDEGISDIEYIESDAPTINKRRLKRKIMEIEDSDHTSDEELNETTNTNNNNFIVNDITYPIHKPQIQQFKCEYLHQLFGNNIYAFLDIQMPNDNYDFDINDNAMSNKISLQSEVVKPVKSSKKHLKGFSVKLSKNRKVLNRKSSRHKPSRYRPQLHTNLLEQCVDFNTLEQNNNTNNLVHRQITCPLFHNITKKEAEHILNGSDNYGKVVFRPSEKGINYLELTWNMHSNIFVHWTIDEKNKPYENAIGTKLIMRNEIYEDLDEIYCNCVQVLNSYVNALIKHKNFKFGDHNDIIAMLKVQINERNRGCYAISFSYADPGYALLSYIPKKGLSVRSKYIKITLQGYKFGDNIFDTASDLINYWKQQVQKTHLEKKRKKSRKSNK